MTMTDEAKALAKRASIGLTPYEACALARYIEDTEARHAAELREQAERFSEAVKKALYTTRHWALRDIMAFRSDLEPFILPKPKPDPLVEAFASLPVGFAGCVDGADALRAAMRARGYEWRKIGADQ